MPRTQFDFLLCDPDVRARAMFFSGVVAFSAYLVWLVLYCHR